ncbi:DUF4190 domain-containing protein [Prosthecobacter sp.]|uniref:DUF4190 domain-containing protein n=1 Tax=Prosthecobacter sp. TaxID=1965333 RepID=UPI001D3DE19E|nr:DUF4190 domain-containing protein [Prosthecobacter sp.]MCB1277378.1 DUF4190 domain-containing protein [Prosthecobacter sp.]
MQYHVAKNGEKSGPFEQEEVYRRLTTGELTGADLGWHEGMGEWEPLSRLLPPPVPAGGSAVFGQASMPVAAPMASAPSSGLAIASMVCGILGFFTIGLTSLPAIIMGHIARSQIKKSGGKLGGGGVALAGVITGYLGFCFIFLAILAALAVPAFNQVARQSDQMKAMNNARQIVIAMKQYAAEHEGKNPATLDVLFDEKILMDRKVLEFPPQMNVPGQGWEYLGAGHTDTDPGNLVIMTSKKPDRTGKIIVARNDGSVSVEREGAVH